MIKSNCVFLKLISNLFGGVLSSIKTKVEDSGRIWTLGINNNNNNNNDN